jgi:hypothetical protein
MAIVALQRVFLLVLFMSFGLMCVLFYLVRAWLTVLRSIFTHQDVADVVGHDLESQDDPIRAVVAGVLLASRELRMLAHIFTKQLDFSVAMSCQM